MSSGNMDFIIFLCALCILFAAFGMFNAVYGWPVFLVIPAFTIFLMWMFHPFR